MKDELKYREKVDWYHRYLMNMGAGVPLNAYVAAWMAQAITDGGTTSPSPTVLNALGTLITTLDGYGLWSRCKAMNILHAGDKYFAKVNLKDPSTYKWTEVNTVTFTEGAGCKSASSSYFNTGLKGDAFAGNALTFCQFVSESNASSVIQSSYGVRTKSATASFYSLNPLTSSQNQCTHASTNSAVPAGTNHRNLYIVTYSGTNIVFYVSGTKNTQVATLQTADISNNRLVLCNNSSATNGVDTPGSYYTRNLAMDAVFNQFNDTDAANFKTAWDAYVTAVSI